jgi:hypothetical protein
MELQISLPKYQKFFILKHSNLNSTHYQTITNHKLALNEQRRNPLNQLNNQLNNQTDIIVSPLSLYTRILSEQSFSQLLLNNIIHIYAVGTSKLQKPAIGWLISANNVTLYQGKCRITKAANNTPLRSTSLAIIAAFHHYQTIYYDNNCPQPKQKLVIIHTQNNILYKQIHCHYQNTKLASIHAIHTMLTSNKHVTVQLQQTNDISVESLHHQEQLSSIAKIIH